jgi:hypothetical protein
MAGGLEILVFWWFAFGKTLCFGYYCSFAVEEQLGGADYRQEQNLNSP